MKCSFCDQSTLFAKELRDGRILCRGCEVCVFFERHLTLTADFAGKPFLLMPWTRETLRDVFGTLDEDGSRQYRDVYLEVPKKNTKTTLCAGLVVCCVATARTTGTEVYSAATAKDQAGIVFRAAAQMVSASPILREKLQIIPSSKRIVRADDPTTFYSALSADGDIHDGIQPSLVVRDELHRWRTRKAFELAEILERGMITRREPLLIDITTAGEVDESPLCWRRHEYARQIEDGTIRDRRFYGRIWAADHDRATDANSDYWKSRAARVAANPSHEDNGGYLKDSVLEDLCIKAQNDPQARADYLRYHLNIWGQKDDSAIDIEQWIQKGGHGVDLREWPTYDVDLLIRQWNLLERECYAGIDASWTTDLTSLGLVFPPKGDDPWTVLSFFWMPELCVRKRERFDKVPYSEWIRKGFVETCSGNAHDYEGIKKRVRWAAEMFDVRMIAFDPANFRPTAMQLEAEGYPVGDLTQRYTQLNQPTKWLLGAYLDGKIRHGNNPVLNWNARCLSLKKNAVDEVMPAKPGDRQSSTKRIDGISAIVTALNPALAAIDSTIKYTGLTWIG